MHSNLAAPPAPLRLTPLVATGNLKFASIAMTKRSAPLFVFVRHVYSLWICFSLVHAGSTPEGGSCSPSNNRLDPGTHIFLSDCDDRTFCSVSSASASNLMISGNHTTNLTATASVNGTCVNKLCRSDLFPFGYGANDVPPPLCNRDQFCPDEGDGCKPLLPPGGACQLNRDNQCSPSSSQWQTLASPDNFNGSICLRSICMFANATIGLPCVIDSTVYAGYGPGSNGQPYTVTVVRDNCRSPMLYCDPSSVVCLKSKALGEVCASDRECLSVSFT